MSAAPSISAFNDVMLIKRLTGRSPKSYEMNFMGTRWCWFEDYQGNAFWLHVDSERLVESARNHKRNG